MKVAVFSGNRQSTDRKGQTKSVAKSSVDGRTIKSEDLMKPASTSNKGMSIRLDLGRG